MSLHHCLVPASEPDAESAWRLTPEEGHRRQADTDRLFAQLAEQRMTPQSQEFVFHGDLDSLWPQVPLFIDGVSQCCPFFTFEQTDSVLLRVSGKGTGRG